MLIRDQASGVGKPAPTLRPGEQNQLASNRSRESS
jgi:hypothetical protein